MRSTNACRIPTGKSPAKRPNGTHRRTLEKHVENKVDENSGQLYSVQPA